MNNLVTAEPGALADSTVKPPALFLRDQKSGARFLELFAAKRPHDGRGDVVSPDEYRRVGI